ncbi:hypothetical protein [Haliangium sp.]|uniref:hypothetical protein n=1 Tax=Haliangium sp. TaxID=2663208 RepID=UPI003D143D99
MDRLYIAPPRSCADMIGPGFDANPTGGKKLWLVGARGGGNSTELRKAPSRAEIDADRSADDAGTSDPE